MALQVAVANNLDALFTAAFSRQGETGAAMAPLHDLIVEKAATGVAASGEEWGDLITVLDGVIASKGFDLTDGLAPTKKTHYMHLFGQFCTNLSTGTATSTTLRDELAGVINERGGPGASHRNAYLEYLRANINVINSSAP